MRIGDLKIPFLLQNEAVVASGATAQGQWTTIAAVWGSLDHASDSQHPAVAWRVTHYVVIRQSPAFEVSAGMRLLYNGRVFMIRYVIDKDEDRRWTKLYVEEITNEQQA